MPRVLGRVRPSTRAPHVAILSYATCAVVLALSGTFAELAVLSTLLVTVPYVGGCAAAVVLARRGVALAGTPLNFRGLRIAAVVGIGSCIALIVLAARMEIIGLFATIAAAAAIYVTQTRMVAAKNPSPP